MANITRSSDILAICFILSNYNLHVDMAQVIENVEAYENENGCYVGTGPEDFRNVLFWLAYNVGLISFSNYNEFPEIMKKISIRELISPILNTREMYCNDEGEQWVGNYALHDSQNDNIDNWFDDFRNPVDIEYEYLIRKFFETPENLTNQSVMAFIREHNNERRILSLNFNRS